MPEAVREMLEAATPKAAKRLIDALDAERTIVVGSGDAAHEVSLVDHEMRTKAANHIMDRIYGKPAQALTGEDGSPLRVGVVILPAEDEDAK